MVTVAQLDSDYAVWLSSQQSELNALFLQSTEGHTIPFQVFEGFLQQDLQAYFRLIKAHSRSKQQGAQWQIELARSAVALLHKGIFNGSAQGLWRRQACIQLLQAFPQQLLATPDHMLNAFALALTKLSQNSQPQAQNWLTQMLSLGHHCLNPETLLQLGQILAWRSGMAQYRHEALGLIPQMPAAIQHELLGQHHLQAWQESPWLRPESSKAQIQIHKVIGEFSGWGGHLQTVPQIGWQDQILHVWDHQSHWQVCADAWGCSWLKTSAEQPTQQSVNGKWKITSDGQVSHGRYRKRFPQLANWRQAKANQQTLAVCMPNSFRIYLIGL